MISFLKRLFNTRLKSAQLATPVVVSNPAPHEQYPEILHWQAGDEIRSDTHAASRSFWFHFVSITAEGVVYGDNVLDEHRFKAPLWRIMRDGHNLSLQDREISAELKQSNEYMQLIDAFNASFAELKERDRKLDRKSTRLNSS